HSRCFLPVERSERRSMASRYSGASLRGADCLPLSRHLRRRGAAYHPALVASIWGEPELATGRVRLVVCDDHHPYGCAHCLIRPLLHVPERPGTTVLFVLSGVHGVHAWRRAVRQHHSDGHFLGTDQPVFLHADRLLAPPSGCPARRTHVANDYGCRRPVPT